MRRVWRRTLESLLCDSLLVLLPKVCLISVNSPAVSTELLQLKAMGLCVTSELQ
jgi:hypothetical protein